MVLATIAIVFLMLLLLAEVAFWPALFSWLLMPFAVIYGLWWSNDQPVFPFSGEIESTAAYGLLWDASILAAAFFGTALLWGLLKAQQQSESPVKITKFDNDRLGALLFRETKQ